MTNDDEQIEAVAEALAETAGEDWKGMMPPSKAYYRRAAQGHALALAILRPLPAPECGERHVGCDDCGPCVLPPGHKDSHDDGCVTWGRELAPEAPAAEDDELPWPCLVRRTVGHFVPGYGGTGVNAPAAQAPAAEAERCGGGCPCGQCLPCVLPPGHEGDHDDGDRTYDHDATRAEIERLRGELGRLTYAAERADDVALQSQESRLTSLDDVSRLTAERDAARAELVAAQDVASRRYGDIQDLRYELKDARAELARLRAPRRDEATREAVTAALDANANVSMSHQDVAWLGIRTYLGCQNPAQPERVCGSRCRSEHLATGDLPCWGRVRARPNDHRGVEHVCEGHAKDEYRLASEKEATR